jgi:putative hydrolase of the HAD superfamily
VKAEGVRTMNVVFDFGAVLFTWRPVELVAQCFPELAATPQQAGHLAHAVFGHPDWHDFDRGTLSMATVVDRTAERLSLNHGVLQQLVAGIGEKLVPMSDSLTLLAQLHAQRIATASDSESVPASSPDVRLYYLSNMPQPYARTLERLHPFLKWFDGGIFSGDVHHIKPEPAIYALLQARYALEPAQTVFIDDLLSNVQAARALGWHGIHFESAAQVAAQLQTLNLSDS